MSFIERGLAILGSVRTNSLKIAGVDVTPSSTVTALPVHNATGGTLSKGTLVYISGWDAGGKFTVAKADADGGVGVDRAGLILTADILDTADGFAQQYLELTTLNTNAGNVGDPVYLSTTAGGWTLTKPSAYNAVAQIVGRISVKSATVGKIQFILFGNPFPILGANEYQAGSILEASFDPATSYTLNARRRAKFIYSVAGGDSGAQGTVVMRGTPLPNKAVIVDGLMRVLTSPVGSGASVAITIEGANDVIAAAAISGAPWSSTGLKVIVPVSSDLTKAIITTQARTPSLVITTHDLSAGVIELWVSYDVSD